MKGVNMRATAMGLAAVVMLGLGGSLAHADPYLYGPPQAAATCNPSYYAANGSCWYGPNYCFRGPCLPPPFNGMLTVPKEYERGGAPAYATPGMQLPPGTQIPPGVQLPPGV